MKKVLLIALTTLIAQISFSQIVSKFSWDGSSATIAGADYGPNATSVSSSAVASLVGHTAGIPNYAVSPGPGSKDLNLTLPNSTHFNIPSMDFSIDFRREESEASFLTRGSLFDFGMKSGKLFIRFTITNELGSAVTVNADNLYNIPSDGLLHRYRFAYDNMTGLANVWVDGTVRYSYTGTANRPLYWTGAGSPVVGRLMDGTGRNVGLIDNLEWRMFSVAIVLPVSFQSFTVSADHSANSAIISWATAQEANVRYFDVQGSDNGVTFHSVSKVTPMNNRNIVSTYSAREVVGNVVRYYRICAVDNDGKMSFTEIKSLSAVSNKTQTTVYPNPALDQVTVRIQVANAGKFHYKIYSRDGRLVQTGFKNLIKGKTEWTINFQSSVPGNSILTIVLENETKSEKSVMQVIRN